ncbi:site-specific DNA-methyltransferase [Leptothrix discophora]|uniref:site-specific DNA-methyltransferase (adenine-specific) n=1 Tax=Leptothrix discophora TaxID=89 RepID=A0ABT9G2U5_LEPDI|nr:site-specific DNA-methyltransferase [Leptothrix discophora]MDP4300750.1 site-specific DNA-methyltransferase [Leptothrix discophora]
MSTEYEHLSREALIELLKRRDSQTPYGLVWERRDIAPDKALNRDFVGLELDPDLSCGPAPWRNLIIEGDNYDALRHLVSTHAEQVQVIYIDPPYNTGRKDFVYNDSYFEATDRYRHSTWLEFMHQRLSLAKDLLAEDGVILVSIDDNELFNLGLLMNRVFGAHNFIGNVIWKNVTDNNPTRVAIEHEYILVYAKRKELNPPVWKSPESAIKDELLRIGSRLTEEHADPAALQAAYTEWYRENKPFLGPLADYKFIDHNGVYAGSRSVHNPGKEGYRYDVPHPVTRRACKQPLMGYRFPWKTMQALIADDAILYGEDENKIVELKVYARDFMVKLPSVIELDGRKGPNELKRIFGGAAPFNNPKPVELITHLLSFVAARDAIVLDFFAGSGTLADAVMQLNEEDGGERRFILVSSTEATNDEPNKNLCRDVCATRVRRIAEGYTLAKGEQVEGLGGSFAYARAKHVPTHRLEERLDDGMVWSYIQMKHHHPLTPTGKLASVSVWNGQALVYLPSTKPKMKAALREALEQHPQAIIYTWTPAALVGLVNENNLREVPADLTRGFRFGKLGGNQA